jgi:mannose-6-phosphate isomerase-like protein (cupin superfamily)
MSEPAAVLEMPTLGVRVEIRRTAAETGGELVEFDVVGRVRGFLAQPHVHPAQSERHEVIEGAMRLVVGRRSTLLRPGDAAVVPPGARHRQLPAGDGPGRVRVQLRPAGRAEEFLGRLAAIDAAGSFTRSGYPRPLAAAGLVVDFGDVGHAAFPPPAVQRALARAVLRASSREYGAVSRQHFKGRLPYHLRTRSRITRLEPPRVITAEVEGDLRGRGNWTLTETAAGGTHVSFEWIVHADRRLLRVLTPLLRPAFRWNHDWAIARAREGLEPYARRLSAEAPAAKAA